MSNYKEETLNLLSSFVDKVSNLQKITEFKADYICIEYEKDASWQYVDVSFSDIASVLPEIKKGEEVTIKQLVAAVITCSEIENPSEELLLNVENIINNSFGINYLILKHMIPVYKLKLNQLNQEAGKNLMNENIFDILLEGRTEFYESSRCW